MRESVESASKVSRDSECELDETADRNWGRFICTVCSSRMNNVIWGRNLLTMFVQCVANNWLPLIAPSHAAIFVISILSMSADTSSRLIIYWDIRMVIEVICIPRVCCHVQVLKSISSISFARKRSLLSCRFVEWTFQVYTDKRIR